MAVGAIDFSPTLTRERAAEVRRAGLAALAPPERLSVSAWAERHLSLSERVTPYPGPVRLARTPYMREIVDRLSDRDCEEITLAKAAQVGYTLALLLMIGYCIDQDPAPALVVMPSENLAKSLSEQRIQPLIEGSRRMAAHKPRDPDRFKLLEMMLDRMTLSLVGANSPANLASRPIRFLFLDEVDKYPGAQRDEAAAADLAMKRTRAFWNRKVVRGSTPTVALGEVWRAFVRGDQRYYWVPCPHCGTMQKLTFGQVKWPEDAKTGDQWDIDRVRREAWYECVECGPERPIRDWHKARMVERGEWRPEGQAGSHFSYQLSALYATWVRFGEVAAEFLESKPYPDKLRNFVNSTLGEPWEERGEAATDDQVLACRGDYEIGTCPVVPLAVLIVADVRASEIHYTVRAWGRHETSWLLAYGSVPTLAKLLDVARAQYAGPGGRTFMATHGFIDSGYETESIYKFAMANNWVPTKGSDSSRQSQPYRWAKVPVGDAPGSPEVHLLHVQTDIFKDSLQARIRIPADEPGAWHLPRQTGAEFARHVTAEAVVEDTDKWGRTRRRWKKLRKANHWLDCEVYQLVGAMVLGVRSMPDPTEIQPPPAAQPVLRRDGRGWFDR